MRNLFLIKININRARIFPLIFNRRQFVDPQQRISNIYIYLYVSDQSVFIGSEIGLSTEK